MEPGNDFQTEKEEVGGSGGSNGEATIMKWKALMKAPTKRVKTKKKTRSKLIKGVVKGAKSRNGEELGSQARRGMFNYVNSSQLGELGEEVHTVGDMKESRDLTCLVKPLHCTRPIILKRGNKS